MNIIQNIAFYEGSRKEMMPNFSSDFPYTSSIVEMDHFLGDFVPWHWHKEIELFYIVSGSMEYDTPGGKHIFPAGSGGMTNTNVLHMTKSYENTKNTVQILHIFDPSFLGGEQGSRIEKNYILPLTMNSQVEIIGLYPEDSVQAEILKKIRHSFDIQKEDFGYEMKLRAVLSEIWCSIIQLFDSVIKEKANNRENDDKLKSMMAFIHEHYGDKISIKEIADIAFISERDCFRVFHDYLHMTPMEYLKSYRLRKACYLLSKSSDSVTSICQECGMTGSSYFGKVFRESFGCTPLEYRRKWQNNDMNGQK